MLRYLGCIHKYSFMSFLKSLIRVDGRFTPALQNPEGFRNKVPEDISRILGCRCDTQYTKRILSIVCHVVYATMGFSEYCGHIIPIYLLQGLDMKIIDSKKLTQGKWLNLFDVTYIDDSGANRSWQVVSRNPEPKCISGWFDRPDAVLMIPYHRTLKKMVVLREYRVALAGFQYEFPAGLIDAGETIEEAARRELMEETGLTLMHIKRMSPPLYNTAGLADESVALVYCECDGRPSNAHNQSGETIEVCMLSPQAAHRMLADPAAKFDTKLWMELERFSRH